MSADILNLMKQVIELAMPNMRHYYRMTRKARVVNAYASSGAYYADVQPLRNDETDDPAEPLISKVEIPVIWGGAKRGIICPPAPGTLCDLSYYDGDPNYPRISNFRWQGNGAAQCGLEELIIQKEPEVSIKIDVSNKIITLTPTDVNTEAGQNWTVKVGDSALIEAGSQATIKSPQINLMGNITATGQNGGTGQSEDKSHRKHEGSYTLNGPCVINGSLVVTGGITGKVNGCSGC